MLDATYHMGTIWPLIEGSEQDGDQRRGFDPGRAVRRSVERLPCLQSGVCVRLTWFHQLVRWERLKEQESAVLFFSTAVSGSPWLLFRSSSRLRVMGTPSIIHFIEMQFVETMRSRDRGNLAEQRAIVRPGINWRGGAAAALAHVREDLNQ